MRVPSVRRAASAFSVLAAACSALECSQSDHASIDGGGQDGSVTPDSGETSLKSPADGGLSSEGSSSVDSGAGTDSSMATDSHAATDSLAAKDSHVGIDSSGSTDGGGLPQLTVVGNHFEDPS